MDFGGILKFIKEIAVVLAWIVIIAVLFYALGTIIFFLSSVGGQILSAFIWLLGILHYSSISMVLFASSFFVWVVSLVLRFLRPFLQ